MNARHGKGIDRDEIRKAVEKIGEDPTYDGTRIAALIGVTDATVKSMLSEMRARQRADSVGIHLNGSVTATPLRVLGQASEKLNDEPFAAAASLAQDTGMSGGELREVIKQMHDAKSDEGALAVVEEHRKARREQIAEYRASGKSKPPPAAKLRQRLGFILEYESHPRDLMELNPEVVAKHRGEIQRSIAILQAVLGHERAQVSTRQASRRRLDRLAGRRGQRGRDRPDLTVPRHPEPVAGHRPDARANGRADTRQSGRDLQPCPG